MAWSVGAGLEGRGVMVTGAAGGITSAIIADLATASGGTSAAAIATPASELALAKRRLNKLRS